MTITWTCPACGYQTRVVVSPPVAARIYGPAELCHPPELGSVDPGQCAGCAKEFDLEDMFELANEKADNEQASRSDAVETAEQERRRIRQEERE